MASRQALVASVALLLMGAAPVRADDEKPCTQAEIEAAPNFEGKTLVEQKLDGGKCLWITRFTGGPEAIGAPHLHTGPAEVYVYVLEGEIVITLKRPGEKPEPSPPLGRDTLHKEPVDTPMQVHNPSTKDTARFLVIQVGPPPRTQVPPRH